MKRITSIIIDDEPLARQVVRSFLCEFPTIDVLAECKNGIEALTEIEDKNPDIIFLDIQMPDLNGFEVLNELRITIRPFVIFTTAYESYAVKAFEVNAVDYLLKPLEKERFAKAVNRALNLVEDPDRGKLHHVMQSLLETYNRAKDKENKRPIYPSRILVKESKKIFFIKTSDINWIEASGDYVKYHVNQKSYLVNDSLNNLEHRLDPKVFFRIHRSSIINVEYIKEFRPYFNGEYTILLKDETSVKLSRSYKDKLKELFGDAIQYYSNMPCSTNEKQF